MLTVMLGVSELSEATESCIYILLTRRDPESPDFAQCPYVSETDYSFSRVGEHRVYKISGNRQLTYRHVLR